MKQAIRVLSVFTIAACLCSTSFAADKESRKNKGNKGKRSAAGAHVLKPFSDVKWSDEQKAKVKEMQAKLADEVKELREAGLTDELQKKHGMMVKEARKAGKKGKDLQAAIKAGLSEEEMALITKSDAISGKLRKFVIGLLTDEQKAALPEGVKQRVMGKKGEGKKKGKKARAEKTKA